MKNIIKICLLASVLSACGGAKFAKMTDFSNLNGDYFAYNIEENGNIGSKNIIYLFGNYKRDSLPIHFSLESKGDSLYISYLEEKDSTFVAKKVGIKGKKKKKYWQKYYSWKIIPLFPLFLKADISRLRVGKDKDNNLLIEYYYDNSGWLLIMGAGTSGKSSYIYKKPNEINQVKPYREGNLFGIENAQRERITAPIYSYISNFKNHRAEMRIGNNWGVIGEDGKEIIPAIYHTLESDYYQPSAYIVSIDGKYGIIDIWGKELLPLKYDEIRGYNEYELIKGDKKGMYIPNRLHIPAIYTEIHTPYNPTPNNSDKYLCFKNETAYIVDYFGYEYEASKRKYKFKDFWDTTQTDEILFKGYYYKSNPSKKRKIALEEESN